MKLKLVKQAESMQAKCVMHALSNLFAFKLPLSCRFPGNVKEKH